MKKRIRQIMGMPITIVIADPNASDDIFEKVFQYFVSIDAQFSPYKSTSELALLNAGERTEEKCSEAMKEILALAAQTKRETNGYFDIVYKGKYDPSGVVKGWAIHHAAELIRLAGYANFFVDAGGDIHVQGKNEKRMPWRVGIRNPFKPETMIKILSITNHGIATSGTYLRGQHIYHPVLPVDDTIVSLTVIAQNIVDADRFATAAFAMGRDGIHFIERQRGLEGYMIDTEGIATYTRGFARYVV